jgi:hypothetical protein
MKKRESSILQLAPMALFNETQLGLQFATESKTLRLSQEEKKLT